MNRINPLYLALLLVVVIMLVIFKLNESKVDLTKAKQAFKDTTQIATELSGLKKIYARKLKISSLSSVSVDTKTTRDGVILSSKEIGIKELDRLMGKILNGTYKITTLKIKKLSSTKASLFLEIKW